MELLNRSSRRKSKLVRISEVIAQAHPGQIERVATDVPKLDEIGSRAIRRKHGGVSSEDFIQAHALEVGVHGPRGRGGGRIEILLNTRRVSPQHLHGVVATAETGQKDGLRDRILPAVGAPIYSKDIIGDARAAHRNPDAVERNGRIPPREDGSAFWHQRATVEAVRSGANRQGAGTQAEVRADARHGDRVAHGIHQTRIPHETSVRASNHAIGCREEVSRQFKIHGAIGGKTILEVGACEARQVLENVSRHIRPLAGQRAQLRLAEVQRGHTNADGGIVLQCQRGTTCHQRNVVHVEENVAHRDNVRGVVPGAPDRNGVGRVAQHRTALLHALEDVPLHMGVRAVEIQHVVARGREDVVENLQHRARTLRATEEDDIIEPRRSTELIALDDDLATRRNRPALNQRRTGNGREHRVPHIKRRVAQRNQSPRRIRPRDVFDREGRREEPEVGHTGIGEREVGKGNAIVALRFIEGKSNPPAQRSRGAGETNALGCGAFRHQPAGDFNACSVGEVDRRAGQDGQRHSQGNGQVSCHIVRARRRRPGRVGGEYSRHFRHRGVVVPNINERPFNLVRAGIKRLRHHPVDARP